MLDPLSKSRISSNNVHKKLQEFIKTYKTEISNEAPKLKDIEKHEKSKQDNKPIQEQTKVYNEKIIYPEIENNKKSDKSALELSQLNQLRSINLNSNLSHVPVSSGYAPAGMNASPMSGINGFLRQPTFPSNQKSVKDNLPEQKPDEENQANVQKKSRKDKKVNQKV